MVISSNILSLAKEHFAIGKEPTVSSAVGSIVKCESPSRYHPGQVNSSVAHWSSAAGHFQGASSCQRGIQTCAPPRAHAHGARSAHCSSLVACYMHLMRSYCGNRGGAGLHSTSNQFANSDLCPELLFFPFFLLSESYFSGFIYIVATAWFSGS